MILASVALVLATSVTDISSDVEAARKANNLPALAVSVVNARGLVAHGVAGVRKIGAPARASISDAFHIGSCTKPMTATVIATLVQDGRMSWDQTIGQAFPDWKDIRDDYRDVRVVDLLTHEGGLPDFGEEEDFKGAPVPRTEFAHYALTKPPVVPPRTAFKYSNAGYVVAAVMAERAAHDRWETLIRTRIFQALHLKSAGLGWPDKLWGHTLKKETWTPVDPRGSYQLGERIAPAGDVHMSADDLAEFLRAHLRALRGERTLITPEAAKFMHTKRIKSGAGFGVQKVGDFEPVSVYSGSADTFVTVFAIAPEQDVAVVVDTNGASEDAQKAVGRILRDILVRFAAGK